MPTIFNYPNEMSPLDTTNLQLEWLQLAGRTLDMQIIAENLAPSFVEVTGVAQKNNPTVSGLNDYDYQNLTSVLGHPNLSLLKCVSKVPLPPEVMEHFAHMQCHCLMGIFPDISRAWLTIDSDIYLWAYEHGTDVAYYDSLGETIISVGLVKPKSGVFQNFVKYLLILTTTSEVVVLGVTFSNVNTSTLGTLEEMNLIPEPVFVLPTDGVSMMVIQSTASGRIFMGGKDGCLYEITYQAQLGWFGKHCQKVNHSTSRLSFLVPSFLNVALYEDDPIVKIEVDNSRHILFTLSEKGNIEVYDLGAKGDSLRKVIKVSQNKIMHSANAIVKTLESTTFKPIISISAVEIYESQHLNLVAVTQTGVRLYFSAGCLFMSPGGLVSERPSCLNLLHVRLPPGFAANSSLLKPKQVHTAAYENGTLMMISSGPGDSEALWCLSADAWSGIPFSPSSVACGSRLREAPALMPMDGIAWALKRLPDTEVSSFKVRGVNDEGRRWCVVWAGGALVTRQLGAADILRTLLMDRGPDSPQVKAFFQMQTEEVACACALQLACTFKEGTEDARISDWATRAFFQYGSRQQISQAGIQPVSPYNPPLYHGPAQHPASPRFSPTQMSTPMVGRTAANVHQSLQAAVQPTGQQFGATSPNRSYFPGFNQSQMQGSSPTQPQFGQQPQFPGFNPNQSQFGGVNQQQFSSPPLVGYGSPGASPQQQFNQSAFGGHPVHENLGSHPLGNQFSPKHNGLYIYVGRILRPIWQMKCVSKSVISKKDVLSSTINSSDCMKILKNLFGVKAFFEKNSLGVPGSHNKSVINAISDSNANNSRQMDVNLEEKQSLVALKVFVNMSCEILSLWKVVVEHQFHIIAAALPAVQQEALQAASFRELMVGGQEVASLLIYSLINQYLTDNASVDSISEKLREVCPTLYRSEEAACSKANEILLFAKQQTNKSEREEMLSNALKLCKDVTPHINLPAICARLMSAGYWAGVVELCTVTAERLDPMNAALHHYKSGRPAHDREGCLAYYKRMEVYREVTNALGQLYERSVSATCPQPIGTSPPTNLASTDLMHSLGPQDANEQLYALVSLCISTSDELLHISVYEWLASKRLHGPLSSLTSTNAASLRSYLSRAAASARGSDAVAVGEMLWKLHEADGDHAAAARALEELATRPGTGVTLEQRLAYLSQGVVCVRGGEGAAGGTVAALARRLEEGAEVARVQARVLAALRAKGNTPGSQPPPHLIQRLDDELLDITQLYEEYAHPYELWECQLAIIQCSGHNDPLLVESIWSSILLEEAEAAESRNLPSNEAVSILMGRVSALAREYSGTAHCFPLEYIVRWLEVRCCKMHGNAGAPVRTLLDVGCPSDQLIDVYTKLIGMNERVWISAGNELYIVEAAIVLMNMFVKDTLVLGTQARRRALVKCQDLVTTCLNMLYSKPNTQELVNVLREIQSRLDKME